MARATGEKHLYTNKLLFCLIHDLNSRSAEQNKYNKWVSLQFIGKQQLLAERRRLLSCFKLELRFQGRCEIIRFLLLLCLLQLWMGGEVSLQQVYVKLREKEREKTSRSHITLRFSCCGVSQFVYLRRIIEVISAVIKQRSRIKPFNHCNLNNKNG